MLILPKPQPGEYAPYSIMYIDLLPDDGQPMNHLIKNQVTASELIRSIPVEKLDVPCAAGEWTIKEILSHIMDTERAFSYRAMRFARNDPTELSSMEQDLYVKNSGANLRSIEDLLGEYSAVRQATLTLFNSFDEQAIVRSGLVNGINVSVRALTWLTPGHELHHLNSIKQNYL
jgi:uncharacterized damage-inducible protein DinB